MNMTALLNIFVKTKKSFEYFAEKGSSKQVNVVLLICCFSLALQGVLKNFNGSQRSIGLEVVFIAITTVLLFVAFKYAYPWLFWKISKLFEGEATLKQTRLIVTLGLLPTLIYLFVGIFLIVAAIYSHNPKIISYSSSVTMLIVALLTFRIVIIGLSYFNKYSYGYALLTLLIPTTIIQLILLVLR